MLRIIKFGAWDRKRKKMWTAEEMGRDELTINPDGRGFVNVHGGSTGLSHYLKHLIPLQYTGLRDKNGKEIYEGDLLREDSPPHHCGEIRYDTGAFYISGIAEGYSELCHILVDEFWAVIGNIYENPEVSSEVDREG